MSTLKKLLIGTLLFGSASFANASLMTLDAANVSDYGNPSQSVDGTTTVSTDGTMIELDGNTWASHSISSYTVDINTVLSFDFMSSDLGEINGIGFDNDNLLSPSTTFQLGGTQLFGLQDFNWVMNENQTYTFSINVGNFFTGTFDRLVFIADSDANGTTANSKFSNISVSQVSAPSIFVLMLAGLGFMAFRRKA